MPRISGVLFLLAIAATWLEAQEEPASDPVQDAILALEYNKGYQAGRASNEKVDAMSKAKAK